MGTFGLGQATPPRQLLLPARDVSEMRRELKELTAVVDDWKKRNPPPSGGVDDSGQWYRRLETMHGDKIRRINYLRNEINAVQTVVAASSEGTGRKMSTLGRFMAAKKARETYEGKDKAVLAALTTQYNDAYYRYLYEGERDFDDGDFKADIKKDKFGYAATLLNLRPDPLGRFLLCDLRMGNDIENAILCLAGDPEGLPLGEAHPDPSEGCLSGYLRMHSSRPGGSRTYSMGLGSTLYIGTMLASTMYGGFSGVYSMDGGCGSVRSEEASGLWENLVRHGLAQEGESDDIGETPEPDDDPDDYDRDEYSDEYGGANEPLQYMSTMRLQKHPAVAFTCSGNSGALPPHHKSDWREPATGDRPAGTPRYGGSATRRRQLQLSDDVLSSHWADTNTPKLPDNRTVEMLAASVHGISPMLVIFVAEAIKNSKHKKAEDLTVAYLTRPDISSMVRGNQRVLELLGQQRLPGLGGLSGAAMREIMGVMRVGRGLGQGDNPLHLPPKSAEVKRLIAQYPEF